ncbi:MAG TPA: hypothetical protein VF803_00850 [Candidatus Paceibacterota bacterium]
MVYNPFFNPGPWIWLGSMRLILSAVIADEKREVDELPKQSAQVYIFDHYHRARIAA